MTFTDIVTQVRTFMRVDSNQWSTAKITYSLNNYLDTVAGYAIGADKRFQWDDTNHLKLPIGTTNLVANQSEYSFLTDEQGNRILTLTRIDCKDANGNWHKLIPIDQTQIDVGLDEASETASIPTHYDKISDNIIKLYPTPADSVTGGLKFYFQRSPSYFATKDTTKEPGVASTLHRGFVIAAAYDGALALGLQNLQPLSVEFQKEEQKMKDYFLNRNNDEQLIMSSIRYNTR
jgi:hypothetical protein